MSKTAIRELEERIVRKLIQDALAKGYLLSVSLEGGHDLEDMLIGAIDEERIMTEAFAGDECHIFVHRKGEAFTENGKVSAMGWVYLVLGNEGWDVISDYTVNLEELLTGSMDISNQYS